MNDQQRRTFPPQTGILHSSESFGWSGITVHHRYHPAGEYVFLGSSFSMLCLHLGPPLSVEQIHNGRPFTSMMTRGSFQVVPSGVENKWRHQDGGEHMHILLTPELLQRVAPDDHPIELLDHFNRHDPRIEHISLALLTEVLEGGATGKLYGEGLATALAVHLIHTYTNSPRPLPEITKGLPTPLFRKITALIEDRLAEDLDLVELASEIGLSPSHFSRMFRKTTGLSPHQYVVQRRLDRAQRLLSSTRLSIGEIANAVGFYDQSHLVRQMRRVKGVTPTYIREHLS